MEEHDITTHVVAVTGIVKKGDKYLLARRSFNDPQAGGQWSFPGGKLDGEVGKDIIENALKREIMEEVGLEIEDHVEFIYNDGFVRVSGHHVIMMTFLCYYKSGEAQPLEDQEEIRWLTLDEMVEMTDELPNYTWQRIEALIEHDKNSK
jgi:ADP-ribose pyrophosphatase YjhB (NUDIX family)